MGYYIRVLGKKLGNIPLDELRQVSQPAVLHSEEEGDAWEQLILSHKSGEEIAIIEKNPVVDGKLGADELREFIDEVPGYKPESAAAWLQQYLLSVKVIYAFQLLSGTDVDDGWTPLHRLYKAIWKHEHRHVPFASYSVPKLPQNREPVFIGEPLAIGLKDTKDGHWIHFEMDLGNVLHRKAFLGGQVPDGTKVL